LKFRLVLLLPLVVSQHLSAANVTVSGRRLLVNGQPYAIQGVDYSPTPVGNTVQNPSTNCQPGLYQWWTDRPTYVADFPLIHTLGANTIRTYSLMNSGSTSSAVLAALDQAQASHLYVVMGYFVQTFTGYDLSNASNQAQITSEVLASVKTYKTHPAVLMWVIGNEQNLNNGDNTAWYSFLNTLAGQVKSADPNHPVGTAEGECPQGGCATPTYNVGNAAVQADDSHMNNLDLWGVNAYRGTSFQGLFQTLASSTTKAIYVTEFGKDAWHDAINMEDQAMQATYINSQWQEIAANLSASTATNPLIGGTVFEWTDEWWKDTTDDCLTHGIQVVFSRVGDTVDPNYQGEWFGLAAVSNVNAVSNPAGTNRSLRKSYTTLQGFWNPAAAQISGAAAGSYFSDTVRNYPNPFRIGVEGTKFVALVNGAGAFDIRIYDAGGQFVTSFRQDTAAAGRYTFDWDGHNRQGAYVSPGLYFAKIHGHSSGHEETQYRRVVGVK
jgi:flagellar hook capping protein FlgD/glycosyl hydrolase family 72 (putative glucanosyltransferase)